MLLDLNVISHICLNMGPGDVAGTVVATFSEKRSAVATWKKNYDEQAESQPDLDSRRECDPGKRAQLKVSPQQFPHLRIESLGKSANVSFFWDIQVSEDILGVCTLEWIGYCPVH